MGMQVEQMRGHLTSCGIDDKLQIVRGCATLSAMAALRR